jgi:hypothetical protein
VQRIFGCERHHRFQLFAFNLAFVDGAFDFPLRGDANLPKEWMQCNV